MVEFSKALQEKLKRDGLVKTVFNYIRDKTWFATVVRYAIDWRFRTKRVELSRWVAEQKLPRECLEWTKNYRNLNLSDDAKMRHILGYVNRNIDYVSDSKSKWKVQEKWQTAEETMRYYYGDCEDGAVLIYLLARELGIPDWRILITAGNVQGGGHCWVSYRADDGQLYPIDWCYWYSESIRMRKPLYSRKNYYNGNRIWFAFNATDGYKQL